MYTRSALQNVAIIDEVIVPQQEPQAGGASSSSQATSASGSFSGSDHMQVQAKLFMMPPFVPIQDVDVSRRVLMVKISTGGGENSLHPYSQQRPARSVSTNLSCCLGSFDNGQQGSTTRRMVLVPHETPHFTIIIPEKLCMLLPVGFRNALAY